jgi:hypothetical protein
MLESRNIHVSATLSGETLGVTMARGCQQGGVLSPLLLSLVVDDLWGLNNNGYYTVEYADDIAILINGKFPQTVSEVLQTAQCTVQQWCERTKLTNDPNKTVVILFTRKRNIKGLREPILFSKRIQLSNEVKYLGVTLDKGLAWKKQLALDMQRHIWENFGTENKGGILDIHCGGKTHSYLCCHYMVAQS